jgi:hypothetical protein
MKYVLSYTNIYWIISESDIVCRVRFKIKKIIEDMLEIYLQFQNKET